MGRGRKLPVLRLTEKDRETLRGWSGRRKTAQVSRAEQNQAIEAE
jgi:hypothetical protein